MDAFVPGSWFRTQEKSTLNGSAPMDQEILKHSDLFTSKINPEDLDELCHRLLKIQKK